MDHVAIVSGAVLRTDGGSLDVCETGRLLLALAQAPRMGAAASALGVSYRGAWGKLVRAERLLGVQLVQRVKGHGSRLTAAGSALAQASRRFERAATTRLAEPLSELQEALAALRAVSAPPLRLAASHDLLLQTLVAGDADLRLDVRFVGSEQALEALRRGEAELAAFHLPEPLPTARERPDVFGDAALFVEPVLRREQGLIVARGNPLRIGDVADLARTNIRFVNRQRGAGTRAWLDRLLREHGIPPRDVRGYGREEYTHLAVAATVAAGAADVGFGLRAAAAQFDLGFVPVGTELYYLCGARALKGQSAVRAVLEGLRARATTLPGYGRAGPSGRAAGGGAAAVTGTRSRKPLSRRAPRRP